MNTPSLIAVLAAALTLGGCAADDVDQAASIDEATAVQAALPEARVGDACGARGMSPCGPGLTCIFEASSVCGATDRPGKCFDPRVVFCTADYDPVCGCDGKTYSNACVARVAGASVKSDGACE